MYNKSNIWLISIFFFNFYFIYQGKMMLIQTHPKSIPAMIRQIGLCNWELIKKKIQNGISRFPHRLSNALTPTPTSHPTKTSFFFFHFALLLFLFLFLLFQSFSFASPFSCRQRRVFRRISILGWRWNGWRHGWLPQLLISWIRVRLGYQTLLVTSLNHIVTLTSLFFLAFNFYIIILSCFHDWCLY